MITLNGTTGITSPNIDSDVGNNTPADGSFTTLSMNGGALSPQTGFKNRIINGAMTIDQRNNGASIALPDGTAAILFAVDRFNANRAAGGTATAQRSTVAPSGYINSFLYTTGTAITPAAGDNAQISQFIEGFNIADFGWGTADAQTVTLSFWVRSSLTGTFSGSFRNSANDRSYVFSFTIASANTFEYKTITVSGDTSGTWLTDNQRGLRITFDMGSGSTNRTATIGSWVSGGFAGAAGSIQLNTTSSATFYITGVQLEKGSTATPFEFRSIGTELALCQRYYEKSYLGSVVPGAVSTQGLMVFNVGTTTVPNSVGFFIGSTFCVTKRAAPTVTIYSYQGNAGRITTAAGIGTELATGTGTSSAISQNSFAVDNASGSTATIVNNAIVFHFVAVSEL